MTTPCSIVDAIAPLGVEVRAGEVAGSGLALEDGGDHELKGVPDCWRLHRVAR